jgi:YHS domain-containing protein
MKTLIISILAISGFTGTFFSLAKNNVLIEGYDPVSYFSNNPQKGSDEITFDYKGSTIWFVNEENRKKFKPDPEKYYPKYGGWCAYAMGLDGSKVDVNPKTYEIRDDGLYLFYNKLGTNTLKMWNDEGAEALKKKADSNWKNLEDKSPND